jgi:2-keto-3-deoxy-L-rhamnonate aldolase RhmA
MSTATLRSRLLARDLLIAPMITLSSPEVTEMLAGCGYDWLFIDSEHAPIEPPQIQALLRAAGPVPCLVRVSSSDPTPIGKALDCGAAGIIVPMVNSAEQAERVVQCAKYAPMGRRGRGLARAHGYGLTLDDYSRTANDTVAVVVQAETRGSVDEIDAIVDVDGLDAVFVGPYDLASSLGHTGDVSHPDVVDAIARVRAACAAKGMPAGILGIAPADVRRYIDQGFTLIIAGIDVLMFGGAAKAFLAEVKGTSSRP